MIITKTDREIEIMRRAGEIVALCHQYLKQHIKPGTTTKQLDKLAEEFIRSMDAKPSFKGYHGFPGTICASVNESVVHGIPGDYTLKVGDIISIDIGAEYKGYHGDSAWTYPIGTIDDEKKHLLKVTEESLYVGLNEVKAGNHLGNVSNAIQKYAEDNGLSVVRELVGHGIGTELHEDPQIPNFGKAGYGPILKPGMTLAIEPMLNAGSRYVKVLSDDWTIITQDGKPSAHFEHTIVVTLDGYEILTKVKGE